MTPREIAERYVSVDESIGEGGMRVFLFGEEVAHFQGASYDEAAYALADELRSKLAAACEEAAAEARRAALRPVEDLLSKQGCSCDCECDSDGHGAECDLCFACSIAAAIRARKEAE